MGMHNWNSNFDLRAPIKFPNPKKGRKKYKVKQTNKEKKEALYITNGLNYTLQSEGIAHNHTPSRRVRLV